MNDRKESSAFSSTDADGLWCAIGVGRCTIDGVGEMRSERLSRDGLASANTSSSRNAAVLRKRQNSAVRYELGKCGIEKLTHFGGTGGKGLLMTLFLWLGTGNFGGSVGALVRASRSR